MNGYDQITVKKLLAKIFKTCCKRNECTKNPNECEHHVALCIGELVDYLDIKEETILTLLCYLESANYIKLLSNTFNNCTIRSYKGLSYLNALSKRNELLSLVFKLKNLDKSLNNDMSEIVVDVIELCEKTNNEYEQIKQKLRNLEWQLDDSNQSNYKSKTGVSVQFSNVCFYIKTKCIFDEDELDEIFDYLWKRVSSQMSSSFSNFKALYKILSEYSFKRISECFDMNDPTSINSNHNHTNHNSRIYDNAADNKPSNQNSICDKQANSNAIEEVDLEQKQQLQLEKEEKEEEETNSDLNTDKLTQQTDRFVTDRITLSSNNLKEKFNQYFNNKLNLDEFTDNYEFNSDSSKKHLNENSNELKRLIADIKKFIYTYNSEIKLNGTSIARIFHGIGSPRFPTEVWGRNRLFWRCHLDFDFETIIKYATEQLIIM